VQGMDSICIDKVWGLARTSYAGKYGRGMAWDLQIRQSHLNRV
jgi:hypothetical protein